MKRIKIEVEIPDGVLDEEFTEDVLRRRLEEAAILELFRDNKITSGNGARLLEISRRDFLDLLEKKGIPLASLTEEDIERDLDRLDRVMGSPKE